MRSKEEMCTCPPHLTHLISNERDTAVNITIVDNSTILLTAPKWHNIVYVCVCINVSVSVCVSMSVSVCLCVKQYFQATYYCTVTICLYPD